MKKRKSKAQTARPQKPAAMPAPAAGPGPKVDLKRAACVIAAFGASGTGKSHFIKQCLVKLPAPVMIFDPKHEYEGGVYTDERAALRDAGMVPRVVFRPAFQSDLRIRQFNRFCAAALAVARNRGRITFLVDELHLVTSPGQAPEYWCEILQTGRSLGFNVLCASIRPAAIDKEVWNIATYLYCGRLNNEDDCRRVANSLGHEVKWTDLVNLRSGETGIQWIERDLGSGAVKRGNVAF